MVTVTVRFKKGISCPFSVQREIQWSHTTHDFIDLLALHLHSWSGAVVWFLWSASVWSCLRVWLDCFKIFFFLCQRVPISLLPFRQSNHYHFYHSHKNSVEHHNYVIIKCDCGCLCLGAAKYKHFSRAKKKNVHKFN